MSGINWLFIYFLEMRAIHSIVQTIGWALSHNQPLHINLVEKINVLSSYLLTYKHLNSLWFVALLEYN